MGKYWNNNGKYQKEYLKLWDEFVPNEGYTDDKYINLLISTGKRYYDLYNNGLGNEDVLWEDFIRYTKPLLNELDCNEIVKYNSTRCRLEIVEEEIPIYVWDDENECETDEIDYYETEENEYIDNFTEMEINQYESFFDSVVKLVYKKKYNVAL